MHTALYILMKCVDGTEKLFETDQIIFWVEIHTFKNRNPAEGKIFSFVWEPIKNPPSVSWTLINKFFLKIAYCFVYNNEMLWWESRVQYTLSFLILFFLANLCLTHYTSAINLINFASLNEFHRLQVVIFMN